MRRYWSGYPWTLGYRTSVYSQTDGIVAWQGCVGTESAHHRNIEVAGVSHLDMVHHPEVLRIVAGLLAHSFC
jgi:hypothetical protein